MTNNINNQIILKGYAYNKKVSHTKSGKAITSFAIKVNNGKDTDGNYLQEFFNCKYWGEPELKGLLTFSGRLAFDTWDKDGVKQVRPYMLVNEIKGNETGDSQPVDNSIDDVPFDF